MRDRDIDDALKRAAGASEGVDPALVAGISRTLGTSLQPVRPLPPSRALAARLVLVCAVVALLGAMLLKPYGVEKMSAWEAGLILPALGILLWAAAFVCVAEAIPGSRRRLAPWMLLTAGCALLAAVFVCVFSDYRMERFVSSGVVCLRAGVLFALPASAATALLLRRGFSVNSAAAGLAKGTLAGLAGVAMLELHCPIFEAPHVLVWHIAVLPVCGAVGALSARALDVAGRSPR